MHLSVAHYFNKTKSYNVHLWNIHCLEAELELTCFTQTSLGGEYCSFIWGFLRICSSSSWDWAKMKGRAHTHHHEGTDPVQSSCSLTLCGEEEFHRSAWASTANRIKWRWCHVLLMKLYSTLKPWLCDNQEPQPNVIKQNFIWHEVGFIIL